MISKDKWEFDLNVNFPIKVVIELDKPGFHGYCPKLKGLHTCGDTFSDTVDHLRDAVIANLESFIREKEEKWK